MGEREGAGSGKVLEPELELGLPEVYGAICRPAAHEAIGADIICVT